MILQHNALCFLCLCRPPPNRRNNLTDYAFTEQLPDLHNKSNLWHVFLVGGKNIIFDNPLWWHTKQTLLILSLLSHVEVINIHTHMCGHMVDWVVVRPDYNVYAMSTVTDSLRSRHKASNLVLIAKCPFNSKGVILDLSNRHPPKYLHTINPSVNVFIFYPSLCQ